MLAPDARGVVPEMEPRHEQALAETLRTECRLLRDLATVLERQRRAVEADDLAGVDESVFAAQRVFRTLSEARRRRRSLIVLLAGYEDVSLADLDEVLGPLMTRTLREARDELRDAARHLEGHLGVNRSLLKAALEAGDRLIRAMSGAPTTGAAYAPPGTGSAPSGTVLLNTQV